MLWLGRSAESVNIRWHAAWKWKVRRRMDEDYSLRWERRRWEPNMSVALRVRDAEERACSLEVRVHGRLGRAGRSAVFCGGLSEAAGSCGAVQRHNNSQGKPSKRDGRVRKNQKESSAGQTSAVSIQGKNISTTFHQMFHLTDWCYFSLLMWSWQYQFCMSHITS